MALTLASPPDFLKLLAHDLRWQLLTALAHSDYRVQELADRLQRPMNLVSYHLRQLREAGLVQERRSSADGRDLYCTLDLAEFARRYRASAIALHPAVASDISVHPNRRQMRLLFLCTHNSARSQMAEALVRAQCGTRPIEVASAGNYPSTIHPTAIAIMQEAGIDIRAQTSKHLDTLRNQHFDYIVTVCDQVREHCPVFSGSPEPIHWSIPDPALATGTPTEQEVFRSTAAHLAVRVNHLLLRLDHVSSSDTLAGEAEETH